MRTLTPLQRAEALASTQEAAISLRQAKKAGLSDDQVERLAATGRWRRALRGVYRVAGAPQSARQLIVIAFLAVERAGGVVSHISAAAEWSLLPAGMLPHVTVPRRASIRCRGAKVHRSDIPLVDRTMRNGIRVTSVSRTIVDLAEVLDRPTLEQVVDDALCRKIASVRSILAAAERVGRGRRGIALLRSVLEAWAPGIEPGSVAEVRLLRRCGELGIVGMVSQHEVFDEDGAFVARLDLARPAQKQALEYEGVDPHNPRRWGRDEPRYARLRALGWEVQPVGKLDLCPGEPFLADLARRWGADAD
jgi:hypothetical protein